MNVYDFDKTIFDGDSSASFYFFCVAKKPSLLLGVFKMLCPSIKILLRRMSKTEYKEKFYSYFSKIDTEKLLTEFWDKNIGRIKGFYLKMQKEDDIIISASPYFLLAPCCERLGIKYLYASEVDSKTGKTTGKNCHGEEKVRRFLAAGFDKNSIDKFYSDALSDEPLAKISKKAYIVVGEKIIPWNSYKLPFFKRIKRKLFARS